MASSASMLRARFIPTRLNSGQADINFAMHVNPTCICDAVVWQAHIAARPGDNIPVCTESRESHSDEVLQFSFVLFGL